MAPTPTLPSPGQHMEAERSRGSPSTVLRAARPDLLFVETWPLCAALAVMELTVRLASKLKTCLPVLLLKAYDTTPSSASDQQPPLAGQEDVGLVCHHWFARHHRPVTFSYSFLRSCLPRPTWSGCQGGPASEPGPQSFCPLNLSSSLTENDPLSCLEEAWSSGVHSPGDSADHQIPSAHQPHPAEFPR